MNRALILIAAIAALSIMCLAASLNGQTHCQHAPPLRCARSADLGHRAILSARSTCSHVVAPAVRPGVAPQSHHHQVEAPTLVPHL